MTTEKTIEKPAESRQPENPQQSIKEAVESDDGWMAEAAKALVAASPDATQPPKDEPATPPKEEPKTEPEKAAEAEPEPKNDEPKDEAKELRRQNVEMREKLLKRERKLAEREAAADAKVREAMAQSEQARKLVERIKAKDFTAVEELGVKYEDWQMRNLANPPSPEVGELKRLVDELRTERQKEREEAEQRAKRQEMEQHADRELSQYMGSVERAMADMPMCKRLLSKIDNVRHPAHPLQRAFQHAAQYAASHGNQALDPAEVARYIEGVLESESKWFHDEPAPKGPQTVSSPKAEPHGGRVPTNSDAGQSATPSSDDDDETFIRKAAAELKRRSAAAQST